MDSKKDVILVVDDEPDILRMATSALSLGGFRGIVAENGSIGLEAFIQHQSEICLVLSDVVMPVLNGLQMTARILEAQPDAKILFMSGYTDVQLDLEVKKKFPFIRKPFLPADLIQKIRETLDSESQATQA